MKSLKKAVIPVAGFGTRFLPATKAVPKALMPIIDIPVVHYLVEEAMGAGVEEIVFVISKFQHVLKNHFERFEELEQTLEEKKKYKLLQAIKDISDCCKFHFVYQDEQLGDGHAILCAKKHIGSEPFLVLFGDDLVDPPAAKDMVDIYNTHGECVIALEEIHPSLVSQYGIIDPKRNTGNTYEIADLIEKPTPDEAPSNLGIVGKYICTPDVFSILETKPQSKDGEIRLIDAFKVLKKSNKLYGYRFPGTRYDIGNKWGYLKAVIDFGLKREDLKKPLEKFLRKKLG